jgi:hypothetical protein
MVTEVISSIDRCKPCAGSGWSEDGWEPCPVCKGSGATVPAVTDYNALVPPENPLYPWQPKGWQLLCYYCAEPIVMGVPEAGHRQRTVFMQGMWRHKDGNLRCMQSLILPGIDPPRCHICGTQTSTHGLVCSAAAKPACCAKPMSAKEDELIRRFGWTPKEENQRLNAKASPGPSFLEKIGALTVLGLGAWLLGRPPRGRQS